LKNERTIIDFFCGAGGFSEGFRQMGFEIVKGYDNWKPAIDTFNQNFGTNSSLKNILDFKDINEIKALPDTAVIIGSPPCVSFSSSNNSGKADKSLGLELTKVFLRIIAVKKHKKGSILKAWFMENVKNSLNYLPKSYKFQDLNLTDWAIENGLSPDSVAITIEGNSSIINSAEYGSAQARKRAITGEIVAKEKLVIPPITHRLNGDNTYLPLAKTLGEVKNFLPAPNSSKSMRMIEDPLYHGLKVPLVLLTDHFYDSGLYKCQWRNSHFLKRNHPYMGSMSFPENENKPSRTITATNIGSSREASIYKSEYKRTGDGEYRVPTVREMASLMGFPITYQFLGGSITSKCRLVGNAVCPSVSRALAKIVRQELNLEELAIPAVSTNLDVDGVKNLNTFSENTFNKPPIKKPGSRFRRHPFKYGNITVTLSNYDVTNSKQSNRWITSVQYGNGEGYPSVNYDDTIYKKIEPLLEKFKEGKEFVEIVNNGFSEKIAKATDLQRLYEEQKSKDKFLEPTELIEEVGNLIDEFKFDSPDYKQDDPIIFDKKKVVPKKQLMALYAINKITSIINSEL